MADKTSRESQTSGVTRSIVLVAGAGTAVASVLPLEQRAEAHQQFTGVEYRPDGSTLDDRERSINHRLMGPAASANLEIDMPTWQVTYIRNLAPYLLSILRVFAAGSFFTHGTMKLFNWPAPFEYPLNTMLYTAGILEILGGLLLAVGLFTRPVAFVLSGLMAFAYFIVHAQNGFFPVLNHGEAALLYCFIFLYFFAAGPGVWSLDALLGRKDRATSAA